MQKHISSIVAKADKFANQIHISGIGEMKPLMVIPWTDSTYAVAFEVLVDDQYSLYTETVEAHTVYHMEIEVIDVARASIPAEWVHINSAQRDNEMIHFYHVP